MMTKTNMMKSVMMLLAIAGSNYSYAQQATVVVSNTTAAQRMELVEVSMADVKAKLSNATPGKGQAYVVKNTRGQQIGSQITHDGKLLIDASVRPHSAATFYISIEKPYPQKVWATGALYKMRKDDLAWENDRCAYRVYGPALQRSGERSFGTDVWVKNTPDTVVNIRYIKNQKAWENMCRVDAKKKAIEKQFKTEKNPARIAKLKNQIKAVEAEGKEVNIRNSFHLDQGNGLDPYRVGATLGLGAPSLMIGNEQILPYCYKDYKILDNGPLRFTVELTYNPSTVGDQKNVVEHRIISLDKGSNFNKMTVWYDGLTHPTDFATGFPIHEEDTETKTFAKTT